MKLLKQAILGAAALLLSANHAFAIEGLTLSVQSSDVVLSWPSTEGEVYIVQYRPTLDASTPWQTLTASWPAEVGASLTFFVHSDIVQQPGGGGESLAATGGVTAKGKHKKTDRPKPSLPLAVPADGSSAPVPLALYPPGFDLSDFLIYEPATDEWFKGSSYTRDTLWAEGLDVPVPGGGGGSGGGATPAETGFYRVVRDGVHLVGVTSGMVLSGIVAIPVEAGTEVGNLVAVSVREDGAPVGNSAAVAPFGFPLHVVLDTTAMNNGAHDISGFASWSSTGDEDGEIGVDAESAPITVTVENEITFPNWIEHFGELYDSLVVLAESAHADADWYVDVYGANAGYIGTFGGHTDNGRIEIAWDLVGPPPGFVYYGSEPYFDFVVTTVFDKGQAAPGQGSTPKAPGAPPQPRNGPTGRPTTGSAQACGSWPISRPSKTCWAVSCWTSRRTGLWWPQIKTG